MNSNGLILLKNLLLSTSGMNTLKYTKDKKKKRKVIGSIVAIVILDIMVVSFSVLMAVGYGIAGFAQLIPSLTVIAMALCSFIFTVLRANGYLFNFKEYDMLMSMPFEIKTVVACKFLYMYIKNLRLMFLISISMMIGYGIYVRPAIYIYPMWIVMSFLIPLIPDVLASAVGVITARIGSGFRFKKVIQTMLTFAIILLSFSLQFIIRAVAENNSLEDVVGVATEQLNKMTAVYVPARWFEDAIARGSVVGFLLFVVVSVAVFVAFYTWVSASFVRINSRLGAREKAKRGMPLKYSSKSVANTIAFKEFKRMLGSVTYLTNAGFGYIFVFIVSVVVLFINPDKVIEVLFQGAPISFEIMLPIIPMMIYFFIGMVSTTCCTMSLEGKNYWIVQSMPISMKELYKGKMLFQLYMNIPFGVLGVLCFGICFKADFIYMLLYVLCILAMCLFSTTFGMFCGIKFMKLDWENDIEVVKQGAAVTVYLLPNMFITMALIGAGIGLSFIISGKLILLVISAVYAVAAAVFYRLVM